MTIVYIAPLVGAFCLMIAGMVLFDYGQPLFGWGLWIFAAALVIAALEHLFHEAMSALYSRGQR